MFSQRHDAIDHAHACGVDQRIAQTSSSRSETSGNGKVGTSPP
jgi:hypothetical protein